MIRRKVFILFVLVVALIVVGVIAWAPWITEEYAYVRVVEHLGGADTLFNYTGEIMPLKDVPKSFKKLPFVSLVYFPGEAMFIVTFYGGVI
jgi:uncharacterized protein YqhQ